MGEESLQGSRGEREASQLNQQVSSLSQPLQRDAEDEEGPLVAGGEAGRCGCAVLKIQHSLSERLTSGTHGKPPEKGLEGRP